MRTLLACTFLAACAQGPKTSVTDDFTGLDAKADSFSYRMKIVGSLDYGQTSASTRYTKTPRYRAFKFAGNEGDMVDVWVKSTDGGDAVAWVLDNGFHVLATNDDADDSTLDSHVTVTLPANASATHYIVFRDYYTDTAHFTVDLAQTTPYDTSCQTDADCLAVDAGGCCPDGHDVAINANATADYARFATCTNPPQVCPQHVVLETRVAQCNFATNHCEMIQPEDIHCGGFIATTHSCPANYTCHFPGVPDAGGNCVPTQP
jgi:outer membrane lipoprotein-sorting protein